MGPPSRRGHPVAHRSGAAFRPRCVLSPPSLRRKAAEQYYRLRARPPLLAARRRPSPPDFVGIGAQRSGTSWWHALIEAHPDVHSLGWPFKELHFFDRFASDAFSDEDVRAYHEWFRKPAGRIAGEWTPRYMFDAHTPALLQRAAPDARLIVMLRDPLSRFRSGFAHALARGADRAAAWDEALQRGMYFAQLTNVLEHYGREQLLVLQFERCVAAPRAHLAATQAFLGLRPLVPAALTQPVNQGRGPVPAVTAAEEASLKALYAPDVARLADAFGEIDVALWPAF